MCRLLAYLLSGAILMLACGCSTGEVSIQDQASKVKALHSAEKDSQAKDGIKSE